MFEVNGVFKFYHQTTPEYPVTLFFAENCNNRKLLKFLFEKVLKKLGYQVIRLFLNDFIAELITARNKNLMECLILRNYEIFNVAAREGNSKTFNLMLDMMIKSNIIGSFFCGSDTKMKSILMNKDENGLGVFYNLLIAM